MTTVAERRQSERVQIYLDAKWEGVLGCGVGTISDIGIGGCHLLTDGKVKEAELVRVEIQLPTGREVLLWGEVTNYVPELGFGLRFTGYGDEEQEMIAIMLEYARQTQSTDEADDEDKSDVSVREVPDVKSENNNKTEVKSPLASVPVPTANSTHAPSNVPLQSDNSLNEVAQLRELPLPVKTLTARTLSEMTNVIEAFSTAQDTKELDKILAGWFKSAKGCIGLLPYGELRRALKNGATTIQQAYYLHAHYNGLMNNPATIKHIEETYTLQPIPPAERPCYLLESVACVHRDAAFEMGRTCGIFQ